MTTTTTAGSTCFVGATFPSKRNYLYHNERDGTFSLIDDAAMPKLPSNQHGAAWGDYDNDGFLDLFVAQGAFAADRQTNLLYRNDGNANAWLDVKLVGTASNRSAIGAKVRVEAFFRGESRRQVRQIISGDSESNQSNALNAHFGLADATSIDTVRVEWPAGSVQELRNVAPRQFLTITEIPCIGDCDRSGEIQVNELVTLMNIGLGDLPPTACPIPGDVPVDNALVVGAVDNALSGCLFREE